MKLKLSGILNIFNRELHFVAKDINILSVILIAPIIYAFLYGSIYLNKVENDVPVAIVDICNSNTSRTFIRNLDATANIKVASQEADLASAKKTVDNFENFAVIYIPESFDSDLKLGKGTDIKLFINSTRFLISNDISKAVNEVVGYFNAGIRLKYFLAQGENYNQAMEIVEPVQPEIRPLFNVVESYGDFLLPGMMILILHQTLLIGLAESFAREREEGNIIPLFKQSNRSTAALIIGKGMFYFLLFGAYAFFYFTVVFNVFTIALKGSIPTLILITMLFLTAVIYFAIYLSSFFKRKIVALQFLTFTSYPVFLISGYSWPMESLPFVLKILANLLPSTPYFAAFTRVTQMGAGFGDIIPEVIHMAALLLLYFTALHFRMKNLIKKKESSLENIADELNLSEN